MVAAPPRGGRRVVAWCLYDFANSTFSAVIAATVFQAYYINRVVGGDGNVGDLWWSTAVAVSMLGVAVSSPVLGAVADLTGWRRAFFAGYTAAAVLATAALVTVDPGEVVLGFVLFTVANLAMEGAVVFYNAYLPEIVPPDRVGRTSGWGFGVGYAGSMLALALAVPLARAGRFDAIWLMVAGLFALFGSPAIVVLGPGGERAGVAVQRAARIGVAQVRRVLAEALRDVPLRRFLLAYFVYLNGVNTAIVFAASFATKTMGLSTADVISLFFVVQLSALVGALAMARPTDVLGPRRVVTVALATWMVTTACFVFVEDVGLFRVASVVAGLGLGTIQAASRAFMARLVPAGREDEFFGFYALCGKSSAPLGAWLFGLVSWATGNQRLAVAALGLFFIGGFLLLMRVPGGGPATGAGAAPS